MNFRSPIFWKIALGVFASIIVVEAVLLVFSWFSERERLLARIDESFAYLYATLPDSDPVATLESLIGQRSQQRARYPLVGYLLIDSRGARYTGGHVEGLGAPARGVPERRFEPDTGLYDLSLDFGDDHAGFDRVWLRIDARGIYAQLVSYVWRIIGLVAVISLFVTIVSLLFLAPRLVRPLQQLNRLLLDWQEHGVQDIATPQSLVERSDELGTVCQSFEKFRVALARSEITRRRITSRFQHYADMGADVFWEVDAARRMSYLAGDAQRVLGIDPLAHQRVPVLTVLLHVRRSIPQMRQVIDALRDEGEWQGSLCTRNRAGEAITVRAIATTFEDECGHFAGYRGTIVDVTVASQLQNELHYRATHDVLTGLFNRRAFDNQLEELLTSYRQTGSAFCVGLLDLDRFKVINDTCGHAAGDLLLRQLAERFGAILPESSILARLGGDEFAFILADSDFAPASDIAHALCAAVESHRFVWEGRMYSVSASIGLASCSPELNAANALLVAADKCCLQAKRNGKNQVRVYNATDASITEERRETEWIARIGRALKEHTFVLFKQRIQPLNASASHTGEDIHFEILLRMKSEEGGYYAPGDFLPVAERHGLMGAIDRWVVQHTVHWLARQRIPATQRFCLNINLSGLTVSDATFHAFLRNVLCQGEVHPGHLCFEITETTAMLDKDKAISFLGALRDLGCQIALDDFGTGFSSLGQIRDLPLDYIKIDGTFIREISSNTFDQVVVRSVSKVAEILRVKTVAEFVESEEARSTLEQIGIDYGQGYLFARPEELDDGTDWNTTSSFSRAA